MIESLVTSIREGNAYKKVSGPIVKLLGAVLLTLFVWGVLQTCNGQTVTGTAYGELAVWANSDHCYRNATEGGVAATASWGSVSFTSNFGRRAWGNCNAKAAGSFANLESDKVNAKIRDFLLLYHWKDFAAGGRIFRNGVQHIGHDADHRYDWYPPSGSWKTASKQCFEGTSPESKDAPCPAYGYYDRAGVVALYNPEWGRFQVSYLMFQWKDNTLPPSNLFIAAEVSPIDRWKIEAEADRDLTGFWSFDAELRRRVVGPLWVGIAAGRFGDPGWGLPGWDGSIERLTATFSIRLSSWNLYD